MIIARLLSPSPLVGFWHHQLYSDLGADTVMESITLIVVNESETPVCINRVLWFIAMARIEVESLKGLKVSCGVSFREAERAL